MKKETATATKPEQRHECLKEAVMKVLKCTELEYCEFQMKQGESYIKRYVPQPEKYSMVIESLMRSRIFWNWWKNQWALRDEKFLNLSVVVYCSHDVTFLQKIYVEFNSIKILISKIHPNRIVLEESYSDMIRNVIREEVKKS
jgi:hypothetical protein